ncbi:ABC transporter ATP-binding protein [Roseinatronobacter sp. S2]|uniref:ABC transporter ATP-binding protein n=1 Tax=Roseinatronobacter sp. S2 TaxID=3035471 RepID=UPI00240FEC7A|nr:ABC transporter ATP-binding protein [Roseinatronobacter sp. S2]WFE76971.1 ABC transporter ATP-binding protein [Roseinatronobacter sp. S2]
MTHAKLSHSTLRTGPRSGGAMSLATTRMTKTFGALRALDDVSLNVAAGSFHALLGENGAGKSTLVKCIMGFHAPDTGEILLGGAPVAITSPRQAQMRGIGMVYQHFTLVPCLTAAENLVISRPDAPGIIHWRTELLRLEEFMDRMPFRVKLDRHVADLSAGERQKLEILKLLYLDQRVLILDEPTSVMTPAEADEVLTLLGGMARRGEITVLMISHKFREVTAFCDSFTVLRRGRVSGSGCAQGTTIADMSRMMIGETQLRARAPRHAQPKAHTEPRLTLDAISADDQTGRRVVDELSLDIFPGEIIGIAGVSGNGQSALVEVLSGQRPLSGGRLLIGGKPFAPRRADLDRYKVFGLPEEPMRNAVVPRMSVAENMAFRSFDKPPVANRFGLISPSRMRDIAGGLIRRYNVQTPSADAPVETLSGGNVQRAVLARELSGDVAVLIVANPCFGLDFASVAEIRAQIMEQRNRGAAVLLVSEDLDEVLELADRVAVMSEGKLGPVVQADATDRDQIGRQMGGAEDLAGRM